MGLPSKTEGACLIKISPVQVACLAQHPVKNIFLCFSFAHVHFSRTLPQMILQQDKKKLRSAFRAFHIVAHLVIVPFFYVDKSKFFHVSFFSPQM